MAKYLSDEVIEKANVFDDVVGANIAMLGKFGICAIPTKKVALLHHYCEENGIIIFTNSNMTLLMLPNLEQSIFKTLLK